jgi:hypothetical protein
VTEPVKTRIVRVGGLPPVYVKCCICGKSGLSGVMFADLNGEPFRAYYCPKDVGGAS